MFGEEVRGKGYSGGQEWDRMKNLEEDLKVFGFKFEGWREAAQNVCYWFQQVEEGAEAFRRKWHKAEDEATAERHRNVAIATLTVDANARARGGGACGHFPLNYDVCVSTCATAND